MQAVIALCHFCENHGPRVVMTTQPWNDYIQHDLPSTPYHHRDLSSASIDELLHFGSDYFDGSREVHVTDEDPRCAACSSFENGSFLMTRDRTTEMSYISSQVATNDRVFHLVKHACLRSLSCEVSGSSLSSPSSLAHKNVSLGTRSPAVNIRSSNFADNALPAISESDRDGVIMFGDDDHGYTLAHTFRLPDAKARGFQRWFSLIILSMDKLLLTNNYSFFVSALSSIISGLQEQARKLFRVEQSELNSDFLQVAVSRASLLPPHFLLSKVTKLELDTSRSLSLITGSPNIFVKLHKQTIWVLRTQTRLCKENYLEGVPTQDMLISAEMDSSEDDDFDFCMNSIELNPQASHLEHVAVLQWVARKLHNMTVSELSPNNPLDILLFQVVTGGQVIVKCSSSTYAKRLLTAFSFLLPRGCARLAYCAEYQHVFRYNILGCPPEVNIPSNVDGVVVISLFMNTIARTCSISLPSTYQSGCDETLLPCSSSSESCSLGTDTEKLDSAAADDSDHTTNQIMSSIECFCRCSLSISSSKIFDFSSRAVPAIVTRYKQLLLDPELSYRVLHAVLRNTREHWLSKAKLIYQLSRQKEGIDMSKVLRIVRCTDADTCVLRFWQAGLSKVYKQHIINTINMS